MQENIKNLPNWVFDVDEVSAGVYKVVGKHVLGCSLEVKGIDSEELLTQAAKDAQQMEEGLKGKKEGNEPTRQPTALDVPTSEKI